jgi:hypothetical protein
MGGFSFPRACDLMLAYALYGLTPEGMKTVEEVSK